MMMMLSREIRVCTLREKVGFMYSQGVCITKTEKAESEAQRGKPKGTLESESRNAIV